MESGSHNINYYFTVCLVFEYRVILFYNETNEKHIDTTKASREK